MLLPPLLAGPGSLGARELWSGNGASLALSGSLRELLSYSTAETGASDFRRAFSRDPACSQARSLANCAAFDRVGRRNALRSLTRLRLRFDFKASEHLNAALVYDNELLTGRMRTFESGLAEGLAGDTFLGAEGAITDGPHAEWRSLLYRGYLHYRRGRFDGILGRQRVAWGVGRLWNPIDRFNAIGPLALEADQSLGIDALRARWSFTGFDFAEAVYAPGGAPDQSRAALRLHGVFHDTDLSLMGGVFERAPVIGVDLARNLGAAAIRLEAVYTAPVLTTRPIGASAARPPNSYWQVVLSGDLNIDIGTGIYVLVEHLYNGNALGFGAGKAGVLLPFFEASDASIAGGAAPATRAILGASQVVSGARNQTGLQIGYDLTPELRLDVLGIADWNGPSAMLFPTLHYDPTGTLELTLGLQKGAGPKRSEYGSRGTLAFLIGELYF